MRGRTNCLLWALAMWWRRRGRPRAIALRASNWGPFPHAVYIERRPYGLRLISYAPTFPRPRLIPPPLFRGRVRWGDTVLRP